MTVGHRPLCASVRSVVRRRAVRQRRVLDRPLGERARIAVKTAGLQAAGRRPDTLVELATHPGTARCPTSLDPDPGTAHP